MKNVPSIRIVERRAVFGCRRKSWLSSIIGSGVVSSYLKNRKDNYVLVRELYAHWYRNFHTRVTGASY